MLLGTTMFMLVVTSVAARDTFAATQSSATSTPQTSSSTLPDELHYLEAAQLSTTLAGTVSMTGQGRTVYAYKGLPYTDGVPQRFTMAEVAKPFVKKSFDATTLGAQCAQKATLGNFALAMVGHEDCLFLNVYTPQEKTTAEAGLAVMVYFHGGDFIHGDSSLYQPTHLLDQDIVLVVVQYRLGALSFFTSQDYRAPGNLALHDQATALEWVESYIVDFGGDADQVTIFGQDAGAISVNYHVLSSISNRFVGAIAQSGSALDVMAFDPNPLLTSYMLATMVPECEDAVQNITDPNNVNNIQKDSLYMCMRAADLEGVALAYDRLQMEVNMESGFVFAAPSVQESSIQFVSQSPLEAIANTSVTRVPMLMGTTSQEGSIIFGKMYSRYLEPQEKIEDNQYLQQSMVPELLQFIGLDDPTRAVSNALTTTYLQEAIGKDFYDYCSGMTDMIGSLYRKSGAMETARQHSSAEQKDNMFVYSFEYEGSVSLFDFHFADDQPKPICPHGVAHSDDLMYVFNLPSLQTDTDQHVTDRMVTLWTNFAKYQNPTPAGDTSWIDLGIDKWNAYSAEKPQYLKMSSQFTSEQDFADSWTVTVDNQVAAPPATSTETTPASTPAPVDLSALYQEYEQLQDQRDAYLVTMVVFIVLFVAALAAAVFFFVQARR